MPSLLTVSVDGGEEFSRRFEDAELLAAAENYGREGGIGFLVQQVLLHNGIDDNRSEPLTLAFEFKEIKTVSAVIQDWFHSLRQSGLVRNVEQQVRSVIGS